MKNKIIATLALLFTALAAFSQSNEKIVSINGAVTEILCELGLEKKIVGVDVTSTYPEAMKSLPKVGHNRNLSSEGILSLSPTLVIGTEADIKPEVKDQLVAAGVKVKLFAREESVEGTKKLVQDVATAMNLAKEANRIIKQIDTDIKLAKKPAQPVKVLFVYARGVGAMSVGGKNTAVAKMIELAGGTNAVGFDDYKPLTPEALVAANPDYILLFESGLKSLGGVEDFLKVQGVSMTNAGKNRKIIEMDGQLLSGFSPRVGKAVAELAGKLK